MCSMKRTWSAWRSGYGRYIAAFAKSEAIHLRTASREIRGLDLVGKLGTN